MSLLVDVHKRLGDFSLDVSFETDDAHETLALLGPSGSGKSLTLKCIAGVLTPDEGRIVLNDRVLFDAAAHVNLPPQRRHVGYLFQQYALFPTMTVEANIAAGILGASRVERAGRVAEQVRAFRLEGLEDKRPAQLSGGQQQRVALARIMAGTPELILLDEPFSALDGHLRWQIELELTDVLHAFPGGAVYVSHNRDEVYRMCDTVCVVSRGRSEEKLTVAGLFETPRTLAAALISGCKNISRAREDAEGRLVCEDWGTTLACAEPMGPDVTHAGVRAHYFEVVGTDASGALTSPGGNLVPCRVARVIDSTFSTIVMLQTPGAGQLRYECEKDAWAALDDPSELVLRAAPENVMPLRGGNDA